MNSGTGRGRALRTVLWGLLPTGLVAIAVVALPRPFIFYNPSPSITTGYYARSGETPATGKIIAFRVPEIGRDYAAQHMPYLIRGGIIKPIAAEAGDTVCTTGSGGLRINGKARAPIAEHDRHGLSLPHWRDCRVLRAGEYFVFSDRIPNSYDSRYYGPVPASDIIGTFRLLWASDNLGRILVVRFRKGQT